MRFRGMLTKGHVLAGLMLAAVVMSFSGPTVTGSLRRLARLAIAPAGDGAMTLTTAVESRMSDASKPHISQKDAQTLATENKILRRRIALLGSELLQRERHIREIQQIRSRYYGPSREMPGELIPARVVAMDCLPYNATRVIKPGVARTAAPGMMVTTRLLLTGRSRALPEKLAVITSSALVGQLTETDAYTARMQLVTDRSFSIPVLIRRVVDLSHPREVLVGGERGPSKVTLTSVDTDVEPASRAVGDGNDGMVIKHVKALHEIRPGDEVWTRAGDALVTAEIPVGVVTEVITEADQPLFRRLRIRPHADLASLRTVYVIVPPGRGRQR